MAQRGGVAIQRNARDGLDPHDDVACRVRADIEFVSGGAPAEDVVAHARDVAGDRRVDDGARRRRDVHAGGPWTDARGGPDLVFPGLVRRHGHTVDAIDRTKQRDLGELAIDRKVDLNRPGGRDGPRRRKLAKPGVDRRHGGRHGGVLRGDLLTQLDERDPDNGEHHDERDQKGRTSTFDPLMALVTSSCRRESLL